MPYGPESSPLERVPFNELPDPAEHEAYLWGNGALACAALLGRAFHEAGWRMQLSAGMVLDDLPIFGVQCDGEYCLQPCAETLLSRRAAERILSAGLMPLLTVKGTGTARIGRMAERGRFRSRPGRPLGLSSDTLCCSQLDDEGVRPRLWEGAGCLGGPEKCAASFFRSPATRDTMHSSGKEPQDQRKAAIVDASTAGNLLPGSDPGSVSSTLLERLKARRPEAWQRLVDLYGPVVYRWCRWSGVGAGDVPDVVQEVFTAIATHIAGFHRQRPGDSFTGWMRTITRNKVYDHFRQRQGHPQALGGSDAQAALLRVREPPAAGPESPPGAEAAILPQALELVRAEFENRTWEAFWRAVIEGQSPAHIAADLGMSVQAVYQAKSRVLRRLRRELGELL